MFDEHTYASLRLDSEFGILPVNFGEIRTATFFHVVQINVKGEDANSGRAINLEVNVVCMCLIELGLFVLQEPGQKYMKFG